MPPRSARIVVVGSTNMDLVIQADRIPRPGETVLGGRFRQVAGGKGANQAVTAARLGAEVAFVGRVGADTIGEVTLCQLREEGIDTTFCPRDAELPHGVALILVDAAGENAIAVAPGANAALSAADVAAAGTLIERADVLLVQLEVPLAAVHAALQIARDHAVLTMMNPAPFAPLNAETLALVDILVPNEGEAAALAGLGPEADEEAVVEGLARLHVPTVLITRGAAGVRGFSQNRSWSVASPAVSAVDTTAAGDCFCGALAVRLGEGEPVRAASQFAAAAAAISVTRFGAQASLPTRTEVEALLAMGES